MNNYLLFENESCLVCFGLGQIGLDGLRLQFPTYNLVSIEQTHGDRVLFSDEVNTDGYAADAHYSRTPQRALCIRTADCLPVMIFTGTMVAAIHAGWRGIVNGIIAKTIARLDLQPGSRAWIGPHIGETSFEVSLDVFSELEIAFRSAGGTSPLSRYTHSDPTKRYVCLSQIARQQLAAGGVNNIQALELDSYSFSCLQSHRRDREKAGRQWSFVTLKK